jgi:hypothetical protein
MLCYPGGGRGYDSAYSTPIRFQEEPGDDALDGAGWLDGLQGFDGAD